LAAIPHQATPASMVALASHITSLTTAEALGLLTACPWTQSNPPDCSLHELRKVPLPELHAMIRHAGSDELMEFASACGTCTHRCTERSRQ